MLSGIHLSRLLDNKIENKMRKKSVIDVDSESDTRREVDELQPEESI